MGKMEQKSRGKQISFNMIASIVSFVVTIGISLFITPIIVEQLGSEAYGFVTLSNSFVSYAALITVALNSMESRFVSISIYQNDYKKANKYFTSVFFANIFIALIMLPVMIGVILKLEVLLDIPVNLVADVKITFIVVFVQFLVEILTSRFEIATYVTNRLNLYYMNQIFAAIIRLATILIGFQVFSVNIVFLVLGSLIGKFFVAGRNMYFTKKFLPELKVKCKYFELKSIKDVASSVFSVPSVKESSVASGISSGSVSAISSNVLSVSGLSMAGSSVETSSDGFSGINVSIGSSSTGISVGVTSS